MNVSHTDLFNYLFHSKISFVLFHQRFDFNNNFCPQPVAGKIQKISLTNFACHESTDLVLNDNVNFFVGPNGCGKSAILTALAVGLGANVDRFGVTENKGDEFLKG